MVSDEFRKLSKSEQEKFGLPEGLKFASPFPFGSMNQSDSRMGMKDQDLFYQENLIKLGDGNLRALWDIGTALYTATGGRTIVSFFFYNVGSNNYAAVFFTDGTAVQVDYSNGAVTNISTTPGMFYNGSSLPACAQWGDQYLIIANSITANSYWLWDSTTLYTAGSLSPQVTLTASGSGYSSAPTVTAYGGSGSGATFLADVVNGVVTGIKVTNSGTGYEPGDQVQLYITGGGSDDGIELTATIGGGSVQSVVITNSGSGYTPGDYALSFSGGGGSGAAGHYGVDAEGRVTSAFINTGGTGYTSTPSVSFPSGGGSGASGVATLNPGAVTGVSVVHGGSNLSGTPTISINGGGGTGATAVATVSGGAIASVTVSLGGTGYTSAPSVTAQTGLNKTAAATVTLMPFGVSGTAIETFQSRVWITSPFQTGFVPTKGVFNVSAPGSFSNFATSSGGLTFDSTDTFLRYQYTNIKQSNGYLYPFGDSSISVISSVQTSGNPPVTVFNYQNTDPQVSTSWRDTVCAYSLTLLFSNPLGVFGLYGGAVRKISNIIDNLFTASIFPPTNTALTPTSAVANIFSKKVYLTLLTLKDPFTLQTTNKMIGWDEKDWFIASQSANLIYIGTQEISSNIMAWGTDGKSLYPLFNTPSSSLPKKLSTKLYGTDAAVISKQAFQVLLQAQDLSAGQTGVNFSVNIDTNYKSPTTGLSSYPIPTPIQFLPGTSGPPTYPLWSTGAGDVYGMNVGTTVSSTSPDFTLNFLAIGQLDVSAELGLAGG